MGVRHAKREELERLECKTLDAQFRAVIQEGLNCSPFEAEAVVEVVKEVYGPYLNGSNDSLPPGTLRVVVVDADEPAGKAVAECQKRTIRLTVHRGAEDDRCLQERGAESFRRSRIPDLCQEALSQGGLLTREDLAYRIFFISPRTISRDLAALRERDSTLPLPLRSTVHDIGPVLTHRVQIVRLALEGKTMTQICQILRHSPAAVANYVSTFTRCAQLARKNMQAGQIAFLLRRGKGLVERYLELLRECETDNNYAYHLEELLRIGQTPVGEKTTERTAYP
jgi:DNA-binding CsgD family transcriptional regulator